MTIQRLLAPALTLALAVGCKTDAPAPSPSGPAPSAPAPAPAAVAPAAPAPSTETAAAPADTGKAPSAAPAPAEPGGDATGGRRDWRNRRGAADKDGDGVISDEERAAALHDRAEAMRKRLDANGDGK